MTKEAIVSLNAPAPIGPYSQAITAQGIVYLSSQAPIIPGTGNVPSTIEGEVRQVLENLKAVADAAGGSLADVVKLTIYLTDLGNFPIVNQLMTDYFREPYPARATIGVVAMPKNTQVGIEGIMVLPDR